MLNLDDGLMTRRHDEKSIERYTQKDAESQTDVPLGHTNSQLTYGWETKNKL